MVEFRFDEMGRESITYLWQSPTGWNISSHSCPLCSKFQIRWAWRASYDSLCLHSVCRLGESFVKYDFGRRENLRRYGQATPPSYDLSKVTTPVYLFYGLGDLIAQPQVNKVVTARSKLFTCVFLPGRCLVGVETAKRRPLGTGGKSQFQSSGLPLCCRCWSTSLRQGVSVASKPISKRKHCAYKLEILKKQQWWLRCINYSIKLCQKKSFRYL